MVRKALRRSGGAEGGAGKAAAAGGADACAAFKNTSGSGLDRAICVPSTTAWKYGVRPVRSRMKRAFLLELATASKSPRSRRALSVTVVSGATSAGVISAMRAR